MVIYLVFTADTLDFLMARQQARERVWEWLLSLLHDFFGFIFFLNHFVKVTDQLHFRIFILVVGRVKKGVLEQLFKV